MPISAAAVAASARGPMPRHRMNVSAGAIRIAERQAKMNASGIVHSSAHPSARRSGSRRAPSESSRNSGRASASVSRGGRAKMSSSASSATTTAETRYERLTPD